MIDFRDDILPIKNRLYRLALRITAHTREAEDIVQETMIKAWNHREELDTPSSAEAFCITACRHLALDSIARKERQNETLDTQNYDPVDNSDDSPFQMLSRQDGLQWIHRLFQLLPEKQRTVLQLRDIEGKSYKEIAAFLEISEEQVKVNIFRARQRIKSEFEKIDRYGL